MSGRFLAIMIFLLLAPGTTEILAPARLTTGRAVIPDGVTADPQRSCRQSQMHPLEVKLRLLEPIVPERWITAEIVVRGAINLDGLSLEISAVRDVAISGRKRVEVRSLKRGQELRHTLQLKVGDTPEQRQLIVVAKGSTEGGTLRRGASLNLLPHGPHHPAMTSPASGKGREVVEYPGAARSMP